MKGHCWAWLTALLALAAAGCGASKDYTVDFRFKLTSQPAVNVRMDTSNQRTYSFPPYWFSVTPRAVDATDCGCSFLAVLRGNANGATVGTAILFPGDSVAVESLSIVVLAVSQKPRPGDIVPAAAPAPIASR